MKKYANILHIMGRKFNSAQDASVLGGQIRQARIDRGLTLVSLGRAVRVDQSQISRYERGQMISVSKNLQKICNFLQINDDPSRFSVASTSLGEKVDELIRLAPEYEPAVMRFVDALEALLTATHSAIKSAGRETNPAK